MKRDSNKTNLRITMASMPMSLDPIESIDKSSARIKAQIFETLFNLDDNLNIVPSLAESWKFTDATTLEITLKKGVKFHNGMELNAEDVEFSINRVIASSYYGKLLSIIDRIEVKGDYIVIIRLKETFVPILAHLSHSCTAIVNKAAVEEVGKNAHEYNPIGTGPFKFEKLTWKKFLGSVEISRFDEYHGKKALIKTVSFKSVPEYSLRISELERGRTDIVYDIYPEDMGRMEENSDAIIIKSLDFSVNSIGFNCKAPPFDNPLVRRAICHGIDREDILKTVYHGQGAFANGPISPKIWGSAHDEIIPLEYDIEKAKALLKEAGYENGFKSKIYVSRRLERLRTAMLVQSHLKLINISCDLKISEWEEYASTVENGADGIFLVNWVALTGDADYGLYQLFYDFGRGSNYLFYSNQKVNELLDAARGEFDAVKRKLLYLEAQKLICDDTPCLFYHQGEDINAVSPNVRGLKSPHYSCHAFKDVYFDLN